MPISQYVRPFQSIRRRRPNSRRDWTGLLILERPVGMIEIGPCAEPALMRIAELASQLGGGANRGGRGDGDYSRRKQSRFAKQRNA